MNSLATKAAIGAVQLLAVLGVLIFLPAGTFAFPQAWIYLAIFAAAVALITVYLLRNDPALLERRVEAGVIAEKRSGERLIQALAACAFASIFGLASLDHRFGWSNVPLWLQFAGDLLTAAGFYIVFLTFRENSFAGGTIDVWAQQRVISSGLYALVRHPMYSGALVMLCGTALALGSYRALLPVVAMTLLLVLRIRDEERLLRERLPGYAEYAERVRSRLVPYVW